MYSSFELSKLSSILYMELGSSAGTAPTKNAEVMGSSPSSLTMTALGFVSCCVPLSSSSVRVLSCDLHMCIHGNHVYIAH